MPLIFFFTISDYNWPFSFQKSFEKKTKFRAPQRKSMRILIVLAALRQGQFHLEDLRTGSASEFRENYAKKRTAKCENVKKKMWKTLKT